MRKIFTTFGLFLITTFSFAQETKYVDTELLNVRSGAGTKYEVIDKISQGEKVTAYSIQGTWTEIELNNGTRGYVSTKFLSNSQNQKSSTGKKGNSWIGYLLVIGFVLYALNKVRKFFTGSNSSSSSQPRERSVQATSNYSSQPKLKLYMCTKCGDIVKQTSQPKNTTTCTNRNFHHWTEIADYGDNNYHCTKCGTTLRTEKAPKNTTTCINKNFHHWTKL